MVFARASEPYTLYYIVNKIVIGGVINNSI